MGEIKGISTRNVPRSQKTKSDLSTGPLHV